MTKMAEQLLIGFAGAFKDSEKADAIQAVGWIPHPTNALADIEADMTATEIDAMSHDAAFACGSGRPSHAVPMWSQKPRLMPELVICSSKR